MAGSRIVEPSIWCWTHGRSASGLLYKRAVCRFLPFRRVECVDRWPPQLGSRFLPTRPTASTSRRGRAGTWWPGQPVGPSRGVLSGPPCSSARRALERARRSTRPPAPSSTPATRRSASPCPGPRPSGSGPTVRRSPDRRSRVATVARANTGAIEVGRGTTVFLDEAGMAIRGGLDRGLIPNPGWRRP
jgi:hypothetical protein